MSRLHFEVNWIESNDPDLRRSGTSAELRILFDGLPITRKFSRWSRTINDRARVPVYLVAEWFVANWWRIRYEAPYESGVETSIDWHLSHDLVGIGGGIVWPRVVFSSDDRSVQVLTKPSDHAVWEPVQYLTYPTMIDITYAEFDQAVSELVALVLARLEDLGRSSEPLATMWSDVQAERSEEDVAEWRRWEARLAYDPDEAPEELMVTAAQALKDAGEGAALEVLPLLGRGGTFSVEELRTLLAEPGVLVRMFEDIEPSTVAMSGRPWEIGERLARRIRDMIGKPRGLLDNRMLSSLLGIDARALKEAVPQSHALGLGVRDPITNEVSLHFRKRHVRSRRFEAARFLVEGIMSRGDAWLPVTDRGTARQKIQRAFAAELLVPIDDLQEFLGNDRSDEKLDEAGDFYEASTYAVRSRLINHGLLPRATLVA